MICFTREFLRRTQQKIIPLYRPARTTIYTGCRIEKIDAEIDDQDRIRHLIVYTRTRPRVRRPRRFFL